MKKVLLFMTLIVVTSATSLHAQTSTPPSSCLSFPYWHVTAGTPVGWLNVTVNVHNPTSGYKSFEVVCNICNTSVCVEDIRQDTTITVSIQCSSALHLQLVAHTGRHCNGQACYMVNLPVSLVGFTAARNGSAILLQWKTLSERNNVGFSIERNASGTFEQIAFVPTASNGGTSDAALNYQYSDNTNTSKGITQYRLRQVDFDGRSAFSSIQLVHGEKQFGAIIAPNPSIGGRVNVIFDRANTRYVVTLSDLAGRTIKRTDGIGSVQITNVPSGFYAVKITDSQTSEVTVQKIIVNN